MSERMLEVSFRDGRMFVAYLHLGRTHAQKSVRMVQVDDGLMVIDYNAEDVPLGIEILAPWAVSRERLNTLLSQLGQPPLSDQESRSLLQAA
jgi:hypothetical protein